MVVGLRLGSFAAVLLVAVLAVLWLEHRMPLDLPVPTGPFAVGRMTQDWSDKKQREVLAFIWYPAATRGSQQATDEYLPAAWRQAVERQRGLLLTQFLTRDLSRVRTHSVRDAAVSLGQRSYPVVLVRAGLAAQTISYTTLAEDLASHGYVVVGFDAPYRTSVVVLPDGRVIARAPQNDADLLSGPEQEHLAERLVRAWSADMSFAVDQLEKLNASDPAGRFSGRLDMRRVGVVGHSLGGATALQFCHDDARCRAGIDVDGAALGKVIAESVRQPFLFLLSDHKSDSDAETSQVRANLRSIYDRLPEDGRLQITIAGANHYMFSDDSALLKSHLLLRSLRMLGVIGIDGQRQLAVMAYCVRSFFGRYLKGESSLLRLNSSRYPEIQSGALN